MGRRYMSRFHGKHDTLYARRDVMNVPLLLKKEYSGYYLNTLLIIIGNKLACFASTHAIKHSGIVDILACEYWTHIHSANMTYLLGFRPNGRLTTRSHPHHLQQRALLRTPTGFPNLHACQTKQVFHGDTIPLFIWLSNYIQNMCLRQ